MKSIAFTRVSSSSQDDGLRQIHQIRKYCTSNGYELLENKTISEVISGVSNIRTGLDKLAQLSKNDADLIIVSESSRLTRKSENDYLDLLLIVQTIQSTGIDLLILGSNKIYKADVKLSLVDVITLVIESDRNSKERLQNKERFRTGKEKKLNLGGYVGQTLPYGYFNNAKNSGKIIKTDYLSINEEQANIIRVMFDLVCNQGYSVNKTCLYLNNVLNYECSVATCLNRLRSKVYTGTYSLMGKDITVPAIITKEQFNQAQINIESNHLFSNKGIKHYNPLKGIAKCSCGYSLHIRSNRTATVYNCTTKSNLIKSKCENFGINSDYLLKIVWNITKNFINVDDFKAKTDEQKNLIGIELNSINKRLTSLLSEKSELTIKIDSLVENIIIADKNIQPILNKKLSELVTASTSIDKNIEKINIELSRTQNKLNDLSISLLPSLISNINDEEKHEIFTKYIDTVVYHSIDKYKGFINIKFKNGVEVTIVTNNRLYKAYELPLNFFFNEVSKAVYQTKVTSESEIEKKFNSESVDQKSVYLNEILLKIEKAKESEYIEYTFSEMFENFPMNEYMMNI